MESLRIAMTILVLNGPPAAGDWSVDYRVMVPRDHCESELMRFNRPGSRYRVVCDDVRRYVVACTRVPQDKFGGPK